MAGDAIIKWRLVRFFCEFDEFAQDKAARIVLLVDKYVDLGTWAAVEDPTTGEIQAAAVWTWMTADELQEWLDTGDRPDHRDVGPYLGFLRLAARPGMTIRFVKELARRLKVTGYCLRYRDGKLVRRGVFHNDRV